MFGIDQQPQDRDFWVSLTNEPLSMDEAARWVNLPGCGAIVTFAGTVRDHAAERPGVVELEYEAYASQVEPRLQAIAEAAKEKWPEIGRVVLWHRVGALGVGECSVVVAVSSAHRGDAFDGARHCIDTLKKTVPIWKRERWQDGEDWGLDASEIAEVQR